MLAKYMESDQHSWDQQLPYTLFAYRCSVQASTQETPFYLLYGRDPVLPIDAALTQLKSPYVTEPEDYPYELSIRLSQAWDLAQHHIQQAQLRQKHYYDRGASSPDFQPGDQVCLHTPAVKVGQTSKLDGQHWSGPFTVLKVEPPNAVIQRSDQPQAKTQKVHFNRLKPTKIPVADFNAEDFFSETGEDEEPEADENNVPSTTNPQQSRYNLRPRDK